MVSVPGYFGDPSAPSFGWVHLPPDGRASGGVVLCPTVAVEEMVSHPALRILAERLADGGLAVVRFDYPGTGDSAGSLGAVPGEPLEPWRGAIRDATALLRRAGAARVALVGIRLGALLAAEVAARAGDVDALVLWDPPATGKAFLRAQRALRAVSVEAAPMEVETGSTELLGMVLPAAVVEALGALDLAEATPLPERTLAVLRAGEPIPPQVEQALVAAGAHVLLSEGQQRFIDVEPDHSVIPQPIVAEIGEWVLDALGGAATELAPPELAAALSLETPGGVLLEERPVRFGEHALFGVLTEPVADSPAAAGTIVFLNAGRLRHTGPARLWVTLARELGALGFRVLRLDLSGLGDSPPRPGRPLQQSYPVGAVDDVTAAVGFVGEGRERDVVLSGLCAGAYHAIEAGLALGVRAVGAINPLLSFDPADWREPGAPATEVAATQPYRGWIRVLRRSEALRRFGERAVPRPVWLVLDRLGLQPAPGRGPAALVASGTELFLLCGEAETPQFTRRSPAQWRALVRSPHFTFTQLVEADHALLGADARLRASALILSHAREHWSLASTSPGPVGAGGALR